MILVDIISTAMYSLLSAAVQMEQLYFTSYSYITVVY